MFARVADSLARPMLSAIGRKPSEVDTLLVILDPDGTTTIYVNEIATTLLARARSRMEAGTEAMKDHLAEIVSADIGVAIPPASGFVLIFSNDWRKGLVFDLGPLQPNPTPRSFDPAKLIGYGYSRLIFGERFVLSDPEWSALIGKQWFLFLGLTENIAVRMIELLRDGRDLDLLLPEVEALVPKVSQEAVSMAEAQPHFAAHVPFLKRAAERLLANDLISAGHIILPRIEGMLRSYYLLLNTATRPTQGKLLGSAFPAELESQFRGSLLRPDRFSEFVNRVIFPDFNWQQPSGSTRHTVGHGVVSEQELTPKSLTIAFFTLHHLLFALPPLARQDVP